MAFTGAFTKTNDSATALNAFILTDTSSYAEEAKVTFSDRYFYLYEIDGSTIPEPISGLDYWDFNYTDYPDDTRLVTALTEDVALRIQMFWVSISPQVGSTYVKSTPFDFLDYANQFKYGLVQDMAANRNLVNNKNFMQALDVFQTNIDSSEVSIDEDDPYESQKCIENLQFLMANPNLFY
jgi:hypothetical protein